jgi:hypothetical protein
VGRATLTDGNSGEISFSPVPPLVQVRSAAAQVVQVRYRNTRQPLEAYIAKYLMRTLHEFLGRGTGQGVMQHVHLGQQGYVSQRVAAGKAVCRGCAEPPFRQLPMFSVLRHQPCDLLARQPCHALDVAQQQAFVRLAVGRVAKPLEHALDELIALVLGNSECHFRCSI